jgi:hypothetical protein
MVKENNSKKKAMQNLPKILGACLQQKMTGFGATKNYSLQVLLKFNRKI